MIKKSEPIFLERDLQLIESLTFNPHAPSKYCSMRSYLHWDDELPKNLSSDGYRTLCDLWIARAVVHHGLFLHQSLDRQYFVELWDKAIAERIKWPGFKRLQLQQEDRVYYKEMLGRGDHFT